MVELHENDVAFYFNRKKLINNFNNYRKIGNIYYPLKTNSNSNIIKTLIPYLDEQNNGFLISNISHFEKLIDIGVSPLKMCFINVLAGSETTKFLYDNGVRFFVFDNFELLKDFSEYADLSLCKISIRLNTIEVFNDKLMHLGASARECINMIEFIEKRCSSYGISFYLQTEIKNEYKCLEKMLDSIVDNFTKKGLSFISIAGLKSSDEINLNYLNSVKKKLNINDIILEPGKHLVGDTVDMKTKIIRIKEINDKLIVIIKNGLYSGFLDVLLYNEKFDLNFKRSNGEYIKFRYEKQSDNDFQIHLCGGSSDSGDIIGTFYIDKHYIKELIVGGEILVKNVGAYFEEFFLPYGGDINKIIVEVNNL